jgi:hypothetical protein
MRILSWHIWQVTDLFNFLPLPCEPSFIDYEILTGCMKICPDAGEIRPRGNTSDHSQDFDLKTWFANIRDHFLYTLMVRFEENKIVIEIETQTPLEDFLSFKSSIRRAIQDASMNGADPKTLFWLVELLEHEELTVEQLKKVM